MGYSTELKEAMLRGLLPPNNESVAKVSREEGIPQQILCTLVPDPITKMLQMD